jgi:hypothetical protein
LKKIVIILEQGELGLKTIRMLLLLARGVHTSIVATEAGVNEVHLSFGVLAWFVSLRQMISIKQSTISDMLVMKNVVCFDEVNSFFLREPVSLNDSRCAQYFKEEFYFSYPAFSILRDNFKLKFFQNVDADLEFNLYPLEYQVSYYPV